jgi:uncharacterized paraquat-inducible protein A
MDAYNCPTCNVRIAPESVKRGQPFKCPSCGAPLVLEKTYRTYVERLHPLAIGVLLLVFAAIFGVFERWLPDVIRREVVGALIIFLCGAIPAAFMKIDDHFHPPTLRDTSKPKPPSYIEV